MRTTPSSTSPVTWLLPTSNSPPLPSASQKSNPGSHQISSTLIVTKLRFSSLVQNQHYPKLTASLSPLITALSPPSLRLRVWVSFSTVLYPSNLTSITSTSAYIPPLPPIPLPSLFTVLSPPAWTTATPSSMVSLSNPSICSNWLRAQLSASSPELPPSSTSLPLYCGYTCSPLKTASNSTLFVLHLLQYKLSLGAFQSLRL